MIEAEKQGFFRDMKRLAEEYVNERITLLKLQAAEKAARTSAVMFTAIVVGILLFFAVLFISALLSYFIFTQTGNWFIALGSVALLFIVLAVVILLLRRSRIYPYITNSVIRLLFQKNDNE